MQDDDKIGYGRPPKRTRFRKGRSGNPKGRPKGSQNFRTLLIEELAETISIREGDRSKRISKQAAIVKRLVMKAVNGDHRAAETIFKHLASFLEKSEQDHSDVELSPQDRKILEEAVMARRAARKGDDK